jgi:hypothetical protein
LNKTNAASYVWSTAAASASVKIPLSLFVIENFVRPITGFAGIIFSLKAHFSGVFAQSII